MAMLTPEMKRSHFENRQRKKPVPTGLMQAEELGTLEIERACKRIRDELILAARLHRAHRAALASVQSYTQMFPDTARSMRQAAAQHRRLWWYAAYAAVREVGVILAGVNGWGALSHDEAGADLDRDARRLLEWLVDVGRTANDRRTGR